MTRSGFPRALMRFQTTVVLFILLGLATRASSLERCTALDTNNITVTQQLYYAGSDYNLQCCFSGHQITWMKNGRPLNKVEGLAKRFELRETNKTLIIYNLREDDAGNYTCIVKRSNGTSWNKTIIFEVKPVPTKKPVFSVRMENILDVSEGENISLECYITSRKRPWVYWFKVNTTAKDSSGGYRKEHIWRERPSKESNLFVSRYELTNLTVGDSGVYQCVALTYDPRRITGYDNRTLKVEARKTPDSVVPSTRKKPDGKTSIIIGTVVSGVLFLATALAVFCKLIGKCKEKTETKQPPIDRSSCTASKHNTNARDDKGDDNCICYEVNDVFISYNNKDGDWVSGELLNRLKENYKVCWDMQDFTPGESIMDNIANCIWRSRKTLLVVTKNFLESDWTKFEVTVAQGRDVKGENILIMIVMEELEQSQLPPSLKHYYKSRTYLEWCNEKVRPHFWERLRSAIGPSLAEFDVISGNVEGNTDADANIADAVDTSDMNVNGRCSETYSEADVSIDGNADANSDTIADADTNADAGSDIITSDCDGDGKVKFNVEADADADACTGVLYKTNGALPDGNASSNAVNTAGATKIADADCNGAADMK